MRLIGDSMGQHKKDKNIGSNIVSYPASPLVYEVAQKEYESELNRSSKLDNKLGIALAFFGAFSIYITKFFNFSFLLNTDSIPKSCLYNNFKFITITSQVIVIIAYVITLILLLLTVKNTKYLHFDCKYFIGDDQLYKSDNVSTLETKVAMRYIGATMMNTKTNDTKAKNFNRAILSLGVLIIVCIISEVLRINFFNLEAG